MKKAIGILTALLLALSITGCGHEHTWNAATCTEPKTCAECGETEGAALGHSFTEATCTEPKTCTVCGATEGAALGHSFAEATCAAPKTCTVCGVTEGDALEHSFAEATCTEPKTCAVCGETEGEPAGHQFTEATYQSPATCTVCGVTEGDVLTPDFVTEGLELTPLNETRPFTTVCWDNQNMTTVAQVTFSDYRVFDSDETHEAKEGYEWRSVTCTLVFSDENANQYGMRYNTCFEDYYNIRFHDDSAVRDEENKTSTYTALYNGQEVSYVMPLLDSTSSGWINRTETFTTPFEAQVPKGYDGVVVGVLNASLEYPEDGYITDIYTPDQFVLFRMD